jgi:hypothetical protein
MLDIPALIGACGGGGGALIAAFSFRQRQRGLRVETDVRLTRAFADLVPIANARGPAVLSEAAASKIAEQTFASPAQRAAALEAAMIISPVGMQTQVAILRAVASLGSAHPLLWEASKAAVETATLKPEWESQRVAALKELGEHAPARAWWAK